MKMTPCCSLQRVAGSVRRLAAFGLMLFLPALAALAQGANGSLTGKVFDAKGAPLPGAVVTLNGTSLTTSTDREGEFYFGSVPAGSYTTNVSYLGLPTKEQPVTVTAGTSTSLNTTLGADVVQLQAFTVEGTRDGQAKALNIQRSSENLKEIIASDAIGRFPDHNASESLQRMSSIGLERDQGDGRLV